MEMGSRGSLYRVCTCILHMIGIVKIYTDETIQVSEFFNGFIFLDNDFHDTK